MLISTVMNNRRRGFILAVSSVKIVSTELVYAFDNVKHPVPDYLNNFQVLNFPEDKNNTTLVFGQHSRINTTDKVLLKAKSNMISMQKY